MSIQNNTIYLACAVILFLIAQCCVTKNIETSQTDNSENVIYKTKEDIPDTSSVDTLLDLNKVIPIGIPGSKSLDDLKEQAKKN